jgi:flavin reductase (DIM6/NTAB) family NADH-FMN oxidoreductase RutF
LKSPVAPDDARQFRRALGSFATGVTIVTTRSLAGEDIGLTANSFNSVSLDPPMVLWSLSKKARSLPCFGESGRFAVHILSSAQEELSVLFARAGANKFEGLQIERGAGDVPLLPGCSARFECRTAFQYDGGDHVIFVGAVEAFAHFDRQPLIFHAGRYAFAVEKTAPAQGAPAENATGEDFLIHLLRRAHSQLYSSLSGDLDRHGLSEDGWFVLGFLGKEDPLTLAQLDRLLWRYGRRVTYDLLASLAANGLAHVSGADDPHTRVSLTENGRRVMLELAAHAKGAESRAERELGFVDIQLVRQALTRLVQGDDEGPATVPQRTGHE